MNIRHLIEQIVYIALGLFNVLNVVRDIMSDTVTLGTSISFIAAVLILSAAMNIKVWEE